MSIRPATITQGTYGHGLNRRVKKHIDSQAQTEPDGLCDDERIYYTTDANMNVVGLFDTSAVALEHYVYDAYGHILHIYDGDWSTSDDDQISDYANSILFAGYYRDYETGFYHVRSRMYHAELGRWHQRDPISGNQYTDGMNLYQHVGSAPPVFLDPAGLKRLQYSYFYGVVAPKWDRGFHSSMQYGQTFEFSKTLYDLLHKDVKDLLRRYGVSASHVKPDPYGCTGDIGLQQRFVYKGKTYDLYNLEHEKEWKVLGRFRGKADDIIVFVPGYIGWRGRLWANAGAGHMDDHVIGVARANFAAKPRKTKVIWLAHEILHHFLKWDIRPKLRSRSARWHYSEGIMHSTAEDGTSDKLGCMTVKALKRAGVTDEEIDKSYIKGATP